jgi:hypothetical protein
MRFLFFAFLLLSTPAFCQNLLSTSTLDSAVNGVLHLDPSTGDFRTDEGFVRVESTHSGLVIDGGPSPDEDDGTADYLSWAVIRCTGATSFGAFLIDGVTSLTLRRVNIRGCASSFAVTLRSSKNVVFDRVQIDNSLYGVGAASDKEEFVDIDLLHNDNITFSQCRFDDNSNTAMSFDSISNLLIDRCSFEDSGSVALTVGPFAFGYSGVVPRRSSNITVTRSNFDNNGRGTVWNGAYRGALALQDVDGIDIADCNFRVNRRDFNGAVSLEDVSSVKMATSLFLDNSDPSNALDHPVVGIRDSVGSISLDSVTFQANRQGRAATVQVRNMSAISSFTVVDCTLENQAMAASSSGAGFSFYQPYFAAGASVATPTSPDDPSAAHFTPIVIRGLTCRGNVAATGGCVHVDGLPRPVHIFDSTFENNDVTIESENDDGSGGAVYVDSSVELRIEDSTFRTNIAADGGAVTFRGHRLREYPVELFARATSVALINCVFEENDASDVSGPYSPDGGAVFLEGVDSLLVEDSAFTGNVASNLGGAVYAEVCVDATVRNVSFAENRAYGGQAALRVHVPFGGDLDYPEQRSLCLWHFFAAEFETTTTQTGNVTLILDDVSFTSNRAEGERGSGGAVEVSNVQSVQVTGVECTDNVLGRLRSSGFVGGCIAVACEPGNEGALVGHEDPLAEPSANCEAVVSSSAFHRNSAGSGGALSFSGLLSVEVDDCTFTDNTAGYNGGAVRISEVGAATVTDSFFRGNEAVRGSGQGGRGGAIYAESNVLTFDGRGLNQQISLSDCIFDGNRAWSYGGAVAASIQEGAANPLLMTRCLLQENVALIDGGAVSATVRGASIGDSTFRSNAAVQHGGAVHLAGVFRVFDAPNITLSSSTFTHNAAGLDGVDVYADGWGGTLRLDDLSLGHASLGSPSSLLPTTPPISAPLEEWRTAGVALPGRVATRPLAIGRRAASDDEARDGFALRVSYAGVRTFYQTPLHGATLAFDVPWFVWVETPEVDDELAHTEDTGVRGVVYFADDVMLDVGSNDPPFALYNSGAMNGRGNEGSFPAYLDPSTNPHTLTALVARTDGTLINLTASFTVKETGGINGYLGSLAAAAFGSAESVGASLLSFPLSSPLTPLMTVPLDAREIDEFSPVTITSGTSNSRSYISGGGLEAALLAMPSGQPARATRFISRGDRIVFEEADLETIEETSELSVSAWLYACGSKTSTLVDFDGTFSINVKTASNPWVGHASQVQVSGDFANCGSSSLTSPAILLHNQWNHIVVTFSAAEVRIFINGYTCTDGCATTLHNFDSCLFMATGDLAIGSRMAGARDPLPGYVRDVRFYATALNQTSVTSLYLSSGGVASITNNQEDIGSTPASADFAVQVDVDDPGHPCAYAPWRSTGDSYRYVVAQEYETLEEEPVSLLYAAWDGGSTQLADSCVCAPGVGSLACGEQSLGFQGDVRTSFPASGSCVVGWAAGATVGQCGDQPCPADGAGARLPQWMTTPAPTPTPPTPSPTVDLGEGEGEGEEGSDYYGLDDDDSSALDAGAQRGDEDTSSLAGLTTGVIVVGILFCLALIVLAFLVAAWRRQKQHGSLPSAVEKRFRARRKRGTPASSPSSSTHSYSKSRSAASSAHGASTSRAVGTEYGSVGEVVDGGSYGAAPAVDPSATYTSSLTQLNNDHYSTAPTLSEGAPRQRPPDSGEYATASAVVEAAGGSRRKKKSSRRRKGGGGGGGGGTELLGVASDSPYARVSNSLASDEDEEDLAEALFSSPDPSSSYGKINTLPGTQSEYMEMDK